jgi:hypothetical protein
MTFTSANSVTDTHAGCGTNQYTIQVPGYYQIHGHVRFSVATNTTIGASIAIDGFSGTYSSFAVAAASGNASTVNVYAPIRFYNAGQTIALTAYQQDNTGSAALNTSSYGLSVFKINGNQQIAATETVAAHYQTDAGTLTNITNITINFDDKVIDTHGAVTTGVGTWKFTAPVAGVYLVSSSIQTTNGGGWATGEYLQVYLQKNGGAPQRRVLYQVAAHSYRVNCDINQIIRLNAGDYIEVIGYQNSGGDLALNANVLDNWVSIVRIGI